MLTTLAGDRSRLFDLRFFLSSPSEIVGFDVKHFLFRYCNMQGKHENDDHQLWRLKVDNSLRVVSGFQTASHSQPDPPHISFVIRCTGGRLSDQQTSL